jgi:hypothetical protein
VRRKAARSPCLLHTRSHQQHAAPRAFRQSALLRMLSCAACGLQGMWMGICHLLHVSCAAQCSAGHDYLLLLLLLLPPPPPPSLLLPLLLQLLPPSIALLRVAWLGLAGLYPAGL